MAKRLRRSCPLVSPSPMYQPEVALHRWPRRPAAPRTDSPPPRGTWGRWNCTQSLVLRKKHTLSKHRISLSPCLVQHHQTSGMSWMSPGTATGASSGLGNGVKEKGEIQDLQRGKEEGADDLSEQQMWWGRLGAGPGREQHLVAAAARGHRPRLPQSISWKRPSLSPSVTPTLALTLRTKSPKAPPALLLLVLGAFSKKPHFALV